MEICIAGIGYVGLSLGVLLAQNRKVKLVDIAPEKVAAINNGKSPIIDPEIQSVLDRCSLQLSAELLCEESYADASYIIVALPTNFNEVTNSFDTTAIDD